jgi:hypothetical protein
MNSDEWQLEVFRILGSIAVIFLTRYLLKVATWQEDVASVLKWYDESGLAALRYYRFPEVLRQVEARRILENYLRTIEEEEKRNNGT